MAVTALMFAEGVVNAYANNITWGTNVKVALLDNTFVPDQDTDATWASISADEVAGTGYTAGGQALVAPTNANTANVITLDANDVTWGSSSITARGAVIYNSSTTAGSANRAVLVLNFGSDK